MPITELLERNAKLYGDETALVEINPEKNGPRIDDWTEYALVETAPEDPYRREITWSDFDIRANRFARNTLDSIPE